MQSHGGRTSTAREVSLMMRAHWVLHGTIGIVGVRHGDVAVVIAQLRGGHGRGCATLRHVSVLIVSERTRRLLMLAILLGIIPLAGAVVSSLRAGSSVRVALPLIHGRRGRWTMGEGGVGCSRVCTRNAGRRMWLGSGMSCGVVEIRNRT